MDLTQDQAAVQAEQGPGVRLPAAVPLEEPAAAETVGLGQPVRGGVPSGKAEGLGHGFPETQLVVAAGQENPLVPRLRAPIAVFEDRQVRQAGVQCQPQPRAPAAPAFLEVLHLCGGTLPRRGLGPPGGSLHGQTRAQDGQQSQLQGAGVAILPPPRGAGEPAPGVLVGSADQQVRQHGNPTEAEQGAPVAGGCFGAHCPLHCRPGRTQMPFVEPIDQPCRDNPSLGTNPEADLDHPAQHGQGPGGGQRTHTLAVHGDREGSFQADPDLVPAAAKRPAGKLRVQALERPGSDRQLEYRLLGVGFRSGAKQVHAELPVLGQIRSVAETAGQGSPLARAQRRFEAADQDPFVMALPLPVGRTAVQLLVHLGVAGREGVGRHHRVLGYGHLPEAQGIRRVVDQPRGGKPQTVEQDLAGHRPRCGFRSRCNREPQAPQVPKHLRMAVQEVPDVDRKHLPGLFPRAQGGQVSIPGPRRRQGHPLLLVQGEGAQGIEVAVTVQVLRVEAAVGLPEAVGADHGGSAVEGGDGKTGLQARQLPVEDVVAVQVLLVDPQGLDVKPHRIAADARSPEGQIEAPVLPQVGRREGGGHGRVGVLSTGRKREVQHQGAAVGSGGAVRGVVRPGLLGVAETAVGRVVPGQLPEHVPGQERGLPVVLVQKIPPRGRKTPFQSRQELGTGAQQPLVLVHRERKASVVLHVRHDRHASGVGRAYPQGRLAGQAGVEPLDPFRSSEGGGRPEGAAQVRFPLLAHVGGRELLEGVAKGGEAAGLESLGRVPDTDSGQELLPAAAEGGVAVGDFHEARGAEHSGTEGDDPGLGVDGVTRGAQGQAVHGDPDAALDQVVAQEEALRAHGVAQAQRVDRASRRRVAQTPVDRVVRVEGVVRAFRVREGKRPREWPGVEPHGVLEVEQDGPRPGVQAEVPEQGGVVGVERSVFGEQQAHLHPAGHGLGGQILQRVGVAHLPVTVQPVLVQVQVRAAGVEVPRIGVRVEVAPVAGLVDDRVAPKGVRTHGLARLLVVDQELFVVQEAADQGQLAAAVVEAVLRAP